jgi:hypothetical protein
MERPTESPRKVRKALRKRQAQRAAFISLLRQIKEMCERQSFNFDELLRDL